MARRLIEVAILGDPRSVEAAFGRSATASQRFQKSLAPLASFSKKALLGIGALGVVTGKMANDFNLAASRIVGLAGVGERQVERWKESMLDLAPAVGKAPKELAEALYFIASSGADTADALDILDKSARASAAGLGETQVVADAVTSAMNAYESSNLKAAEATDILVATVREGKGEADAIAGSIGNVVPIAAQLGVGFDEVGAALASMTRLGFDASTAATNLSGVFNALLKPADDSEKALKGIGTSAEQVRNMLAQRGLLQTLQFLEDRFKGNEAALARVFRDVRGFRAVLSLVGKSAEGTSQVFRSMQDNTGALGTAFGAVAKEEGFQLQQQFARLQAEGIRFGESLAPIGTAAAGALADLAGFLGDNEQAARAATVAIIAFSTATIVANTSLKIYNASLLTSIGATKSLRLAMASIPWVALGIAVLGLVQYLQNQGEEAYIAASKQRDLTDAVNDYHSAISEGRKSREEYAGASRNVERAEIAVSRAQDAARKIMKDGNATLEDRREAQLNVADAQQSLRDAQRSATSAGIKFRNEQLKSISADQRARHAIMTLHEEFKDWGKGIGPGGRIDTSLERFKAGIDENTFAMHTGRRNVERYASAVRAGATKIQGAAPQLAETARVAALLSEAWGRVVSLPSAKAFVARFSVITTVEEHRASTLGGGKQTGGPVFPGHAYVVGEKRPEVLVMGRGQRGHVYPSISRAPKGGGSDGGLFEVVFMDWDRGVAKMRRVADAQHVQHARVARQRQRMGA